MGYSLRDYDEGGVFLMCSCFFMGVDILLR